MEASNSLSYISAQKSCPIIKLTAHQLLEKRAADHPNKEMYVFVEDNERVTFKHFKERVENIAAGLLSLGMKKGDKLALWTNIHMEYALCLAAARSIGLVAVRIQSYHSNNTVHTILRQTNSKVIILGRSPKGLFERLNIITKLENGCVSMDVIIGVGENNKRGTRSLSEIESYGSNPKYKECFHQTNSTVKFDDECDIFNSSGSTGFPKLIVHTNYSVINGVNVMLRYIEEMPDKENRKFLALNSYHISGEASGIMPPLTVGITSVLPSAVYSIQTTLQTIQDEKCTDLMFLVSSLYDFVNYEDVQKYDISSVSVCSTGGSGIPLNIVKKLEKKHNIKVLILYGSTETMCLTSSLPWDPTETRHSAGKPLSNVEIQIVNDNGDCVPVGEIGEVVCRTAGMFKKFCGEKEGDDVFLNDGWLKTSDLGFLDNSGNLSIIGRKQDIIVRGAVKIYPFPMENLLSKLPSINKVQVISVPDERLLEDVCVCIRPEDGMSIDEKDIVAYLEEKMGNMYLPGYVLMFDDFVTTTIGKIDRRLLAKQAILRIQTEKIVKIQS